jgi:hypothetical protein
VKEIIEEGAKSYNRKSDLLHRRHPGTTPRCDAKQQQRATVAVSARAYPSTAGEVSSHFASRHNQQEPSLSVQATNASISYLNDMFKVFAAISRQIVTEFIGAEPEKDRIEATTKKLY